MKILRDWDVYKIEHGSIELHWILKWFFYLVIPYGIVGLLLTNRWH